jgi:hypothetical protein
MGIAWGELESEGPTLIVGQGVDFRRAAARERPMAWRKAPLLRRLRILALCQCDIGLVWLPPFGRFFRCD